MADSGYAAPPASNWPAPAWGPLTAGQIVPRIFHLYRENFATYLGVSVLGGVVLLLLQLPLQLMPLMQHRAATSNPFAFLAVMAPMALLITVAIMFVSVLIYGAMFAVTDNLRLGRALTVGEAVEATTPRSMSLFGGYVLAMLRILGWGILFGLGVVLIAVLVGFTGHFAGVAMPNLSSGGAGLLGAGILALGVLLLLFLVAYIWFFFWVYGRYILFIPILLIERTTANESLNRSVAMSRGSRGRIYTVLLTVAAVSIVGLLAAAPFIVYAVYLQRHGGAAPAVIGIAQLIVLTLVQVLLTHPVLGIGIALCYFDLDARRRLAPPVPQPIPVPGLQ